jgi:hypothetical protein
MPGPDVEKTLANANRSLGASRALMAHSSAMMDSVMMMLVVVKAGRPGRGAGKSAGRDRCKCKDD